VRDVYFARVGFDKLQNTLHVIMENENLWCKSVVWIEKTTKCGWLIVDKEKFEMEISLLNAEATKNIWNCLFHSKFTFWLSLSEICPFLKGWVWGRLLQFCVDLKFNWASWLVTCLTLKGWVLRIISEILLISAMFHLKRILGNFGRSVSLKINEKSNRISKKEQTYSNNGLIFLFVNNFIYQTVCCIERYPIFSLLNDFLIQIPLLSFLIYFSTFFLLC